MAKASTPAPSHTPDEEPLVDAVHRLTAEITVFRQVMDEIREDFSWLTRNGLPVQPIEHVHVVRMALDPCAEDWGDRLEIERSTYTPRASTSPLESDVLDRVTEDLTSALEAAAQGHLEFVLSALERVRDSIVAVLKHRQRADAATPDGVSLPPVTDQPQTPESEPATSSSKPRPGHLF